MVILNFDKIIKEQRMARTPLVKLYLILGIKIFPCLLTPGRK
jgi:hypothetical protein